VVSLDAALRGDELEIITENVRMNELYRDFFFFLINQDIMYIM